jgi:mRNA-degrading endonuclease toxin of MazEF toxin-antitoxin module
MQPERGDVVRSSDPFKLGDDRQRPWLIVSNDSHPFDGEQYIAVAISTKKYDDSIPLSADVWEVGGVPRQSFVSPWAVHSPRSEDFVAWQGCVTNSFVNNVVEAVETYLREV